MTSPLLYRLLVMTARHYWVEVAVFYSRGEAAVKLRECRAADARESLHRKYTTITERA